MCLFLKLLLVLQHGVSLGYLFLSQSGVNGQNGYEVVLVNRNVTDSFRVGQDGCTNDKFVCPDFSTCQSDGSCLCNFTRPNYRNPVIEMIDSRSVSDLQTRAAGERL